MIKTAKKLKMKKLVAVVVTVKTFKAPLNVTLIKSSSTIEEKRGEKRQQQVRSNGVLTALALASVTVFFFSSYQALFIHNQPSDISG